MDRTILELLILVWTQPCVWLGKDVQYMQAWLQWKHLLTHTIMPFAFHREVKVPETQTIVVSFAPKIFYSCIQEVKKYLI